MDALSYMQTCAVFTPEEKRVLVCSQKVDDRRVTAAKFRRMLKGCALLQNILRQTLPAKAEAPGFDLDMLMIYHRTTMDTVLEQAYLQFVMFNDYN